MERGSIVIFYFIRTKSVIVNGIQTMEARVEKEGYDLTGFSFLRVNSSGMHEYVPTEELEYYQGIFRKDQK